MLAARLFQESYLCGSNISSPMIMLFLAFF
jgi:hypothetical protein